MLRKERAGGHPSRKDIVSALINGPTKVTACRALGTSRTTLYRWLADPDLIEAYEEPRAAAIADATDSLQTVAEKLDITEREAADGITPAFMDGQIVLTNRRDYPRVHGEREEEVKLTAKIKAIAPEQEGGSEDERLGTNHNELHRHRQQRILEGGNRNMFITVSTAPKVPRVGVPLHRSIRPGPAGSGDPPCGGQRPMGGLVTGRCDLLRMGLARISQRKEATLRDRGR